MVAAGEGHLAVTKALLARGADAEAVNGRGTTAVAWASSNGHDAVASHLSRHAHGDASGHFGGRGAI